MKNIKSIIISIFILGVAGSIVLVVGQARADELGAVVGPDNSQAKQQEKGADQGQQSQEGQGEGQMQQIQAEQETQNQGEEKALMVQEETQLRARNTNELRQMTQEKESEANQEAESLEEPQKKVYQNQNKVRTAVHSLLAMEGLVGGIGPEVSQIAQEFNNSVQATIRAEEKIQTRNRMVRFFIGGDKASAELIGQEINQNRQRIEQLRQLENECECEEDIKAIFQEQIQNIEQEQNRLQLMAQAEKEYQWLFGRLFGKLFGWLRNI